MNNSNVGVIVFGDSRWTKLTRTDVTAYHPAVKEPLDCIVVVAEGYLYPSPPVPYVEFDSMSENWNELTTEEVDATITDILAAFKEH